MKKLRSIFTCLALLVLILSQTVYAQNQEKPFTVGLLIYDTPTFIQEMADLGYVEGENINYMALSFEGVAPEKYMEEYTLQMQAMIAFPVDVLVVNNDTDAVNLRELAPNIPTVFTISDDPIATGAVKDMTMPGENSTGIVSNRHHELRLELLTQIEPETRKVYYLYSSQAIEGKVIFERVHALGEELGVEVIGAPVADVETGIKAVEEAPEDIDWFFLTPFLPFEPEFYTALFAAAESRQAAVANFFSTPFPGFLVSYGPDLTKAVRQSADIVDQILRGADPADIPVITTDNALAINLEVSAALGMEIPTAVLRRADLIVRPGDLDNMWNSGS